MIAVAIALAACAPTVDGPAERQRALDREDAARLERQLGALPGVVGVQVVLHRAVRDPLATTHAAPSGSILVTIDDRADRTAITDATRRLGAATAPEVALETVVIVGVTRPVLAKVGPFTVEQASQGPLKAVLGSALGLVLALAGWIAWRERQRRGNSAQ
jgi:hypothetical protein